MTEQDLEIQKLRQEVKRLRYLFRMAVEDLKVALTDNPCRVCSYADADCVPGQCVPEWRCVELLRNKDGNQE